MHVRRPGQDARGAGLLRHVARTDAEVARRVQELDSVGLDHAMRLLSASADHSKLWVALGAVLLASGRPRLQAGAVSGLGSAALASLLVNQGLKRALPRRRPVVEVMAERRRLRRVPSSGSFPSGHAASASAFAAGVTMHEPRALALVPLAAVVGYSRVHTGVHFLSDVVVGAGVGALIAGTVHRVVARRVDPLQPVRRASLV